jgi:alpha-tubulin suppressor-like RCC1 family protein
LSSRVAAIAAGIYHTCALLASTGGVQCWGSNGNGQLGDGTTTDRHVPTSVVGLSSGVAAIAAGYGHTCALLASTGGVQCWGLNNYGQLGDGTTTEQHVPTNVLSGASG